VQMLCMICRFLMWEQSAIRGPKRSVVQSAGGQRLLFKLAVIGICLVEMWQCVAVTAVGRYKGCEFHTVTNPLPSMFGLASRLGFGRLCTRWRRLNSLPK